MRRCKKTAHSPSGDPPTTNLRTDLVLWSEKHRVQYFVELAVPRGGSSGNCVSTSTELVTEARNIRSTLRRIAGGFVGKSVSSCCWCDTEGSHWLFL